ncbi:MAG: aspartyl beta-hydroxylase [Nevskia sp.]|nr:aspartyl beta-hydroxylase [Nevskia sp.]
MTLLRQDDIAKLEAKVLEALQRGSEDEGARWWERILAGAPDHPKALLALSQRAFRGGDLARARTLLERLVQVDGSDAQQWINLAVVCQGLRDDGGEERAIRGALTVDPSDLLGLLLRAALLERQGKVHAAASAYGAAAKVAPPLAQLNPSLRPAVQRALAFRARYEHRLGTHLDQFLEPYLKDAGGEQVGRFRDSVDIMLGRKHRYDSQSALYHYPGLAPISFFERADFPWLDPIEAATGAIREEFMGALEADGGRTPYLNYAADLPHHQFAELNNSARWSAIHLYQDGLPVARNASRCPLTMELLAGAPLPEQAGRTPSAMFSLLKPQTRIPPHTGVSNARLVTHLPLIVPERCGFRVGNETREWISGRAWVFDDTIEHEAWNLSEQLRVVLIFDIWHPNLSLAERALISAMTLGINAFAASSGGFDL